MDILRSKVLERGGGEALLDYGNSVVDGIYSTSDNGFFFQQRRGHLNLRELIRLDIDKLVREVDIDLLNMHLENITFCNLREEDLRFLTDPQIVKLFKISQCTIEYLLYSQDKLVTNLNETSKKYVNKKKSLQMKRKEMAELTESTKQLRNQVKAKKQNIHTLEELLKETSKARENEFKHMKEKIKKNVQAHVKPGTGKDHDIMKQKSSPSIISFYVADPEGLCVEFTERVMLKVADLYSEVRKAFVSKRDGKEVHLKLIHKGKLLLENQTLSSANIAHGDTIIVGKEVVNHEHEQGAKRKVKEEEGVGKQDLSEMMNYISKQQDSMKEFAQEVKSGWETALHTIAASAVKPVVEVNPSAVKPLSEELILQKIEQKWQSFESGMKENLDSKLDGFHAVMNQYISDSENERPQNVVMVNRRRVEVGELEDDEETTPAFAKLSEVNSELRTSNQKLNELQHSAVSTNSIVNQLTEALRLQNIQVEEIRGSIAARNVNQPSTHSLTTQPATQPAINKTGMVTVIDGLMEQPLPFKVNKWNTIAAAGLADSSGSAGPLSAIPASAAGAPPSSGMQQYSSILVFDPTSPAGTSLTKQSIPSSTSQISTAAESGKGGIGGSPNTTVSPSTAITFPVQYNPGLSQDLVLELQSDLTADDVVFEIRKAAAQLAHITIARVTLMQNDKPIGVIGLDTDSEFLSAPSIAKHAIQGKVTIAINTSSVATNDQIDMFTSSWERHLYISSAQPSPNLKVFGRKGNGSSKSNSSSSVLGKKPPKTGTGAGSGSGSGNDGSVGKTQFKPKPSLRPRRSWDDDDEDREVNSVMGGPAPSILRGTDYKRVMSSLDKSLSDVSDKEGLTDDELQERLNSLRTVTADVPAEVSAHLTAYKRGISQSVVSATFDTRTEAGLAGRSGLALNKQSSMRVSGSVKSSLGSTGTSLPLHRRSLEDYESEEDSPVMLSIRSATARRMQDSKLHLQDAGPGRYDEEQVQQVDVTRHIQQVDSNDTRKDQRDPFASHIDHSSIYGDGDRTGLSGLSSDGLYSPSVMSVSVERERETFSRGHTPSIALPFSATMSTIGVLGDYETDARMEEGGDEKDSMAVADKKGTSSVQQSTLKRDERKRIDDSVEFQPRELLSMDASIDTSMYTEDASMDAAKKAPPSHRYDSKSPKGDVLVSLDSTATFDSFVSPCHDDKVANFDSFVSGGDKVEDKVGKSGKDKDKDKDMRMPMEKVPAPSSSLDSTTSTLNTVRDMLTPQKQSRAQMRGIGDSMGEEIELGREDSGSSSFSHSNSKKAGEKSSEGGSMDFSPFRSLQGGGPSSSDSMLSVDTNNEDGESIESEQHSLALSDSHNMDSHNMD